MEKSNETKKRKTPNMANTQEQEELQNRTDRCKSDSKPAAKKKKKVKEVAIFGNYRSYYGYRIGKELDVDPRVKVMKKEWFEGKDCLDIGCNSGIITVTIAKKFRCNSILGIDIDSARIADAHWTLRNFDKIMGSKMDSGTVKSLDREEGLSKNSCTKSQSKQQQCNSETSAGEDSLEKIVSFEKGNFVQYWHPPMDKLYHTIICLSVTKWIQLNWGDDGLITLFSKVWRFLHPGGVFIVEPQPWSSYESNRLVSKAATDNYQNIQIAPRDFQDLLLDKIGFRRVEHINSGSSGKKGGFNRPMLAFWK